MATLEQCYPMCAYGERKTQDDQDERYFGKISTAGKFLVNLPSVPYIAMTVFREGSLTLLYTNDYPRAAAGALGLMNSLEIVVDVPWDPVLANWSDNFRSKICGFWAGRRRPFLIAGAFLVVLFSLFLVQPPMELSGEPPEGSGLGRHSYWRIVDCDKVNCDPGALVWSSGVATGPAALAEVKFYETGFVSNETQVLGEPLTAAAGQVMDGNEKTIAGDTTDILGVSFSGEGKEILNVKVLLQATGKTTIVGVQYSDDGVVWKNAAKPGWYFEDVGDGKWRTYGWTYTTVKSIMWYGFFNVLVGTIAHSMREVPMEGFLAEISPDVQERTSIVTWKAVMQLVGMMAGSVMASMIMSQGGGEYHCQQTPGTGCSHLAPTIWTLGLLYIGGVGIFSMYVKERSPETLPSEDAVQSLAESFVSAYLNRPLRVLTIVAFVINIGLGLQGPVLSTYYMKYVLNDDLIKERYGIDRFLLPMIVGVLMLVCMPIGLVLWTLVIGKIGRFRALLYQLSGVGVVLAGQVLVGEGDLFPYLGTLILFGLISAGFSLTMPTMMMDIVDYDEFLTGQRREALIQMVTPFCAKLAGLPTKVFPLMAISYFGFNPRHAQQNAAVTWTIKLCMSVLPALAFAPAVYIFWKYFPMRTDSQKNSLDDGLQAHKQGDAAADPYFVGSMVPAVSHSENGDIQYGDLAVGMSKANVLQHFFPHELDEALRDNSLECLATKQFKGMLWSAGMIPIGAILGIGSFASVAKSTGDPSAQFFCTIGLLMFALGALLFWFETVRYYRAKDAIKQEISMDEVKVVRSIYQGFLSGEMATEDTPIESSKSGSIGNYGSTQQPA